MAKQTINIGAVGNDPVADTVRDAYDKTNENFDEVYGLLPIGTATAVGAIANGDVCQLYASSGLKIRKADADDTTKPAHVFVKVGGADGVDLTFYGPGLINDAVAGLTPGATYYLSTTAGVITDTVPATTLNGQQIVGVALSATRLMFTPGPMFEAP